MLWFALVAPVAFAGPFEDGYAAYNEKDYATALRLWRPLADQGDAEAQSNLGLMYYNGQGVPQDYTQAVAWLRKAADQGYMDALNNLGTMYEKGLGVPQDYVQAHRLYNLAAAGSSPEDSPEDRKRAAKNRDRLANKVTPPDTPEGMNICESDRAASGRWFIASDMNCDASLTISDVKLWLGWLFFLPGDGLHYALLGWQGAAIFLELTPEIYGGWVSGILSAVLWLVMLMGAASKD